MVLRLIRALPGEAAFLAPVAGGTYRQRSARVAAPGPHDFAVRCERLVRRAETHLTPQRPSQPAPRSRDDRANVPRGGAGWKVDTANQNSGKEKYFRYWGLTGFRQTEVICPSGKPGSATPPIFVIVWRRGNTGLAKT